MPIGAGTGRSIVWSTEGPSGGDAFSQLLFAVADRRAWFGRFVPSGALRWADAVIGVSGSTTT